ncbi:MAG: peptide deformylase [Desulfotomaculaceae bacterium]|nr:peptide deformylase [Bacillota bacterium]MDD4335701.1 peptide deformylase [Desulfotomaculaceae bacterium]OQA08034.1 MAG: Peptide deformylase [Firmicutes bacterium ADurb.Bin373]
MAVYKIVEIGDEILKEKAKPVKSINANIIKLLDNMADTLADAKGAGLAAPQIGVSKRVIVVDVGEGLYEMVNPQIINTAGQETDVEGCLSIPGLVGDVTRAATVKVRYLDRHGKEKNLTAKGMLARALQHEIDHLEGILYIDRAVNIRKLSKKEA